MLQSNTSTIRNAADRVKEFIASETALFVGRCIAAPAGDPDVARKNGRVFASGDLAEEYQVNGADGSRPHFVRWMQQQRPESRGPLRRVGVGDAITQMSGAPRRNRALGEDISPRNPVGPHPEACSFPKPDP